MWTAAILALGLAPTTMEGSLQPGIPGRLRSIDPFVLKTIQGGTRRSPTFAELVQVVEHSDFIVYVERVASLSNSMEGTLLHGGTGTGYLRVLLKRGMSLERTVRVLAHELQHVRELVESGSGTDASAMDALFSRIGDRRLARGSRQQYETSAALQVQENVARELRSGSRPTPRD